MNMGQISSIPEKVGTFFFQWLKQTFLSIPLKLWSSFFLFHTHKYTITHSRHKQGRRKTFEPIIVVGWRYEWGSLEVLMVKNLPAMLETWDQSLSWEDPLKQGMATHSSILAWKIPWTEEPGGLQSLGSQRARYDWVTNTDMLSSTGIWTVAFKRRHRCLLWLVLVPSLYLSVGEPCKRPLEPPPLGMGSPGILISWSF